jgi:putative hydrolase of the HAD superfamily
MLKALRAGGWRIAILTNGLPHVQVAKIRALDLRPLVDHVVYAEEYAEGGKPARGPFLEVLRRLGVSADQCVCVGDDPRNDIQGARAVGIRTIRVARPGVKPSPDQEADAVVHMVTEVPARAAALVEMVTAHVA